MAVRWNQSAHPRGSRDTYAQTGISTITPEMLPTWQSQRPAKDGIPEARFDFNRLHETGQITQRIPIFDPEHTHDDVCVERRVSTRAGGGMGMFAKRDIQHGELMGFYDGVDRDMGLRERTLSDGTRVTDLTGGGTENLVDLIIGLMISNGQKGYNQTLITNTDDGEKIILHGYSEWIRPHGWAQLINDYSTEWDDNDRKCNKGGQYNVVMFEPSVMLDNCSSHTQTVDGKIIIPSDCVMASRNIKAGEELYYDYGYEYWLQRNKTDKAAASRSPPNNTETGRISVEVVIHSWCVVNGENLIQNKVRETLELIRKETQKEIFIQSIKTPELFAVNSINRWGLEYIHRLRQDMCLQDNTLKRNLLLWLHRMFTNHPEFFTNTNMRYEEERAMMVAVTRERPNRCTQPKPRRQKKGKKNRRKR